MTAVTQTWDPDRYRKNAGFVAELGMPVVDLLAPKPGERILDLGCGDGALTQKLVALGCNVKAVDASPDQIRKAQEEGLDAEVMNGQDLTFGPEFDAVFSNAGAETRRALCRGIGRGWQCSDHSHRPASGCCR